VKQWDDRFVSDALVGEVNAYLSRPDAPGPEDGPLEPRDVFVQQDHSVATASSSP
jgi:hypothetical protein